MMVLFEVAIQIARVVDKRRARRADSEYFHDVPDDEASPLDPRPSALPGPTPVDSSVDEPSGSR